MLLPCGELDEFVDDLTRDVTYFLYTWGIIELMLGTLCLAGWVYKVSIHTGSLLIVISC